MTLTIVLKPETEKRLAERAKQNGLKIETYLEVFIEESFDEKNEVEAAETEKPFHETATKEEWLAAFHQWIDSHKDRGLPHLSDEALRRENIYEDRF